jgi:hypothetical protein
VILLELKSFVYGTDTTCEPSLATLVAHTGIPERTVSRKLASLKNKGYLDYILRRKENLPSIYNLLFLRGLGLSDMPALLNSDKPNAKLAAGPTATVADKEYKKKSKNRTNTTKHTTPATKLLCDFMVSYKVTCDDDYTSPRKPDLRRARALLKKHPIDIIYTSLDLYFRDNDLIIQALPSFASFYFHTERYAKSHYQEINNNVMSLEAKRNVR